MEIGPCASVQCEFNAACLVIGELAAELQEIVFRHVAK